MKPQATRCTQRELAMLAYWQQRGFDMRKNRHVPLSPETPPSFATDHPIADAMIGLGIIVMIFSGAAFWIATAAKLV